MANGFTNEDTYAAAVVIDNEEPLYLEARSLMSRFDVDDLDDSGMLAEMRDALAPLVESFALEEDITTDEVDWSELAERYMEED